MDFKLGEKVVYPNHGVGLIEQISFGYVNGKSERFYMLRIASSGLKVMVPQSNVENVGLGPSSAPHKPAQFSPIWKRAAPLPTTIGSIASRKIQTGCERDR